MPRPDPGTEKSIPARERLNNLGVENENLRPDGDGRPPRSASEPKGAKASVKSGKTATDPSTGAPRDSDRRS